MHITQKSKEVWDKVAQSYISELTSSDIEIADAIEKSLKDLGLSSDIKLIELGCGSGNISARLGQKGYKVSLLDFSSTAIEKAKQVCEKYNVKAKYYEQDFFNLEGVEQQDIVWNSGVLEHFNEHELSLILKEVKRLKAKYFIFLVPNINSLPYILFRYHKMSRQEWEYDYEYLRDNYKDIVESLGMKVVGTQYLAKELTNYLFSVGNENSQYLQYLTELNENNLLEDSQLYLKMYVVSLEETDVSINIPQNNKDEIGFKTDKFNLISIANGYKHKLEKSTELLKVQEKEYKQLIEENEKIRIKNSQLNSEYNSINKENIDLKQIISELNKEKQAYIESINLFENTLQEQEDVIRDNEQKIQGLIQANAMQSEQLEQLMLVLSNNEKINKLTKEIEDITKNNIESLTSKDNEINRLVSAYQERQDAINQLAKAYQEREEAINYTNKKVRNYEEALKNIYDSHLWKAGLKYYRIRDNFPLTKWIHQKVKKKRLQESVEENVQISNLKPNNDISIPAINDIETIHDISKENSKQKIFIEENIEKQLYNKQDILLLSVIDWDFRFQRPQHLAKNLAKLGHRVFYFNANYHNKEVKIREIDTNLFEVTLGNSYGQRIYDIEFEEETNSIYKTEIKSIMDQFNIREASVIVEYPTWEPVARYMKEMYGFKVAFDYIDDYTGFEETNNSNLLAHTKRLLKLSDLTIATSLFLQEKAAQYSNHVKIIRNGTEFDFFHEAYQEKIQTKNRPKIGYYGAIAEWFDAEKVAYIAENRPEYEIELIGYVSDEKANSLRKYKNVKFLGEKDYKILPKYLKEYDVCLIPFQSDIDLIKATNPVKFYEYLSAGKKIVATEIPELEPFRDEYVYLANDKEKFLEYVEQCIEGRDMLKSPVELSEFAKTHDWEARCKTLEQELKEVYPLVSIILVTYNNLHYTKQCMESLINKTAYPNYEVIIVDNDSKDETPLYLKRLEQEQEVVKVILNDTNAGFAGGNNIGIRASQGEYIILLNNDTLVTRGWITSLIKHLDKDKIGMVGPVTNSIGNESQINIGYNNVEDMDKFAIEYTTLHHNEVYKDIKVLAMFCVAIKRKLMDEIGLLDENYKIGMFEDDDYSMAVTKKGYEVICVEDTFIHHFGSVSFKKIEDKKYQEIFNTNKDYFEKKWNVVWTPHKYREGVTV